MLLRDKVAIVTGGTRGIGEAIVKRFVDEGCTVCFTFFKNRSLASRVEAQTKGKARGYRVDVTDFEKMKKFAQDVKRSFKGLDILVNNAGIVQDKPFLLMDEKDWTDVIDTNLTGTFNAARACIFTFMKQKSGNIINISSLSGMQGVAGQTNYAASKAGIIGFTRALAREAGPYNVRVNAIVPGYIETDMTANIKKEEKERIIEETPLRRFGLPGDVAELALFLASDKSSYITGQTLIIDGGLSS